MPWGVLLLMGGGFAIAQGFQDSKLTKFIGEKLASGAASLSRPAAAAVRQFDACSREPRRCLSAQPTMLGQWLVTSVHAGDCLRSASRRCGSRVGISGHVQRPLAALS